jgi:hypothetical protein
LTGWLSRLLAGFSRVVTSLLPRLAIVCCLLGVVFDGTAGISAGCFVLPLTIGSLMVDSLFPKLAIVCCLLGVVFDGAVGIFATGWLGKMLGITGLGAFTMGIGAKGGDATAAGDAATVGDEDVVGGGDVSAVGSFLSFESDMLLA